MITASTLQADRIAKELEEQKKKVERELKWQQEKPIYIKKKAIEYIEELSKAIIEAHTNKKYKICFYQENYHEIGKLVEKLLIEAGYIVVSTYSHAYHMRSYGDGEYERDLDSACDIEYFSLDISW